MDGSFEQLRYKCGLLYTSCPEGNVLGTCYLINLFSSVNGDAGGLCISRIQQFKVTQPLPGALLLFVRDAWSTVSSMYISV